MRQQRLAMVGVHSRIWTMRQHFSEHVALSDVGKVGAELGRLRANLDLGPKRKVKAHELLYNFY